jgi:hypothetical protein
VRKIKTGKETCDLFAFLTTAPTTEVGAVHPEAMPVILTTEEERDAWMRSPGRGEAVAAGAAGWISAADRPHTDGLGNRSAFGNEVGSRSRAIADHCIGLHSVALLGHTSLRASDIEKSDDHSRLDDDPASPAATLEHPGRPAFNGTTAASGMGPLEQQSA